MVGAQNYCGSPSQASDVHYFATQAAFDNWGAYRDIDRWHQDVQPPGLAIVEMGQRPTGGYKLSILNDKTRIADNTLTIAIDWHAPRADAAVSQAMTTQCVALALPNGQYSRVDVVDQVGNQRGSFEIDSAHSNGS